MQLGLTEAFLTWTAPSKATDDIIQLFSQAIHEWMCKTAAPFFLFNIGFNSQITHSVPKCVWVSLPAEVCVVLVFLLRSAALRLFLPSVSLTLICFCLFLCHVYFSLICCFSCCRNIFERKKWGNEFKNSLKPASYALVLSSTSAVIHTGDCECFRVYSCIRAERTHVCVPCCTWHVCATSWQHNTLDPLKRGECLTPC